MNSCRYNVYYLTEFTDLPSGTVNCVAIQKLHKLTHGSTSYQSFQGWSKKNCITKWIGILICLKQLVNVLTLLPCVKLWAMVFNKL